MFSFKWFVVLAAAVLIGIVVALTSVNTSSPDRNVPGHTTGPGRSSLSD